MLLIYITSDLPKNVWLTAFWWKAGSCILFGRAGGKMGRDRPREIAFLDFCFFGYLSNKKKLKMKWNHFFQTGCHLAEYNGREAICFYLKVFKRNLLFSKQHFETINQYFCCQNSNWHHFRRITICFRASSNLSK